MLLQWTPLISLRDIEKEAIRQAVLHHSGNLTAAAEDLDIGSEALRRRFYKLFTEEERLEIKPPKIWWKR